MTLTLESARAELRAARNLTRLSIDRDSENQGVVFMFSVGQWSRALNTYRYARCIDLDYAIRLKKHGVNPAELGAGR